MDRTQFPYTRLTRNVIPLKIELGIWFLFSAAPLMLLQFCIKFYGNIFIILKLRSGNNVCIKFYKGHNPEKMEPEFLVHVQLLSLNLACRQKDLGVSII